MPRWVQVAILAIGFTLGIALMGVQMAAVRLMTPQFGSDINVWASTISTVMLSLMAGYYIGGRVADRHPTTVVLGVVVVIAGLYLLAIPQVATALLEWTVDTMGFQVWGVLTAASLIMLLPMTLLSFFSPYAVRLLLADTEHGGRVAGSVYSITTVGNIVGTLGTTLYLITVLGTRHIMMLYAGVVILCGIALILLRWRARAA